MHCSGECEAPGATCTEVCLPWRAGAGCPHRAPTHKACCEVTHSLACLCCGTECLTRGCVYTWMSAGNLDGPGERSRRASRCVPPADKYRDVAACRPRAPALGQVQGQALTGDLQGLHTRARAKGPPLGLECASLACPCKAAGGRRQRVHSGVGRCPIALRCWSSLRLCCSCLLLPRIRASLEIADVCKRGLGGRAMGGRCGARGAFRRSHRAPRVPDPLVPAFVCVLAHLWRGRRPRLEHGLLGRRALSLPAGGG